MRKRTSAAPIRKIPDTDGDGLSDGDEVYFHNTDPTNPDTDGDGLNDGFEVEFDFDPNDPNDSAAADPDEDGLTNSEEQRFGTDPFDADTDDGGRIDGHEVFLDGTDPTNPSDDLAEVEFLVELFDGGGYRWDLTAQGVQNGSSNAFDFALRAHIDGRTFPALGSALAGADGRPLVVGPATVSDLEIIRKIFVSRDQAFIRYLEIIENPGATDVAVSFEIFSNLGSDTLTEIVATSDGDLTFTTDDLWIVTDDADGSGTPAVAHVFAGATGSLGPVAVSTTAPGGDVLTFDYELTIPAAERRILMHFAVQSHDRSEAVAAAQELAALVPVALTELLPNERLEIVNFLAFVDTDGDGLTDDEEELIYGTDPELY